MTDRNLNQRLIKLARAISKQSVTEALAKQRKPAVLSGTVEAMDEDLDIVFIRMDGESTQTDFWSTDNYENPGVIAATRLGETYVGQTVRVAFDAGAGASAIQTSVPNFSVLPFGTEDGQRIVQDGEAGTIAMYNDDDELVGFMDPTQFFVGVEGSNMVRIDPFGGLRMRDEEDRLRVLLSGPDGLTVRDPDSGISGALLNYDGLIVLDPVTGDRLSITSGTTSAIPTPHYVGNIEANPGTSHTTPAVDLDETHADDLGLRFVCASAASSSLGATSYTPPAGFTEIADFVASGSGQTLAVAAAYAEPVDLPHVGATFTNSSSSWLNANGHSVVVHGDGTVPSVRSTEVTSILSTARAIAFDIDAPTGLTEGDVLIGFVAIEGPNAPIGWTVPEGWKQLGTQVSITSGNILASGVWYKVATAADELASSVRVNINMAATGTTRLTAIAVAVQDAYFYPGGLDIRLNNRSMPRGVVHRVERTSPTTTWNGTQLPQVAITMTSDVHLMAGRRYRLHWRDLVEQGILTAGHYARMIFQISRDGGSSWENVARAWNFRTGATGVWNYLADSSASYKPASDEDVRFRVVATTVGGSSFTLLFSSNDSDAVAFLEIEDQGGEF
jgi:hypothetical protein